METVVRQPRKRTAAPAVVPTVDAQIAAQHAEIAKLMNEHNPDLVTPYVFQKELGMPAGAKFISRDGEYGEFTKIEFTLIGETVPRTVNLHLGSSEAVEAAVEAGDIAAFNLGVFVTDRDFPLSNGKILKAGTTRVKAFLDAEE